MTKKYLYSRKIGSDGDWRQCLLSYVGIAEINKEWHVVFQFEDNQIISFTREKFIAMVNGAYKDKYGEFSSIGFIDESSDKIFFPDGGIVHDARG